MSSTTSLYTSLLELTLLRRSNLCHVNGCAIPGSSHPTCQIGHRTAHLRRFEYLSRKDDVHSIFVVYLVPLEGEAHLRIS